MTEAARWNAGAERQSTVMEGTDMVRVLKRLAHEIVERNGAEADLVLAGIPTRGVPLAERLAGMLRDFGHRAEAIRLEVEGHRDDREPGARNGDGGLLPAASAAVTDRVVVLVDDVIFHGRTARAAMDALTELGRPRAVQLAVMIDRGHRELPIRADFVGKNIPTHLSDRVRVQVQEVDGQDAVVVVSGGD
jgi:pyrimidine operon attenuation protein/uracil phosphoribosyltransferase